MQLETFRIETPPPPTAQKLPLSSVKLTQPFLKGPIPLAWLAQAGTLPGRALHVATVIWYRSGVEKSRTVSVPSKTLEEFGVDRYAKKRALIALENAGLISVEHHHGRNPMATIIMHPALTVDLNDN